MTWRYMGGRAQGAADALHRGRRLEVLTVSWNALEATASLVAALLSGSPALLGFGVDSAIESASGATLLWRLQDGQDHARREETALKLVGVSFLVLGAYVAWVSARALLGREAPEASRLGIVIALLSLLVMPWLARQKRGVARELGSRALEKDSRQTDICAYLSAILLVGLALNALLGWWWTDPAAALLMVGIITREGVEALRGERCEAGC